MTARRVTMDGRRLIPEAGTYSICFSIGALEDCPGWNLDGLWTTTCDAGR